MIFISRKEAKEKKLARYFTGNACKHGHVNERATRNGECLSCAHIRLIDWKKNNKEYVSLYQKKYKENNKINEYETRKKWFELNPEKKEKHRLLKNKCTSIWNKKHRDKRNANLANYRFTKIKGTPNWLDVTQKVEIDAIYLFCDALKKCGLNYHVDHIIPLRGKNVNGLHTPWNLQVIHATENIKKGNRI